MADTSRDTRADVFLPVTDGVDRYVRSVEPATTQDLKQRLGLSSYITLGGATSLFDWAKSGLSSGTSYLLGKTQAQELLDTVNLSGQSLLSIHAKIQQLQGPARDNARSHWTQLAYRQQKIVEAVNTSASKTLSMFGNDRVSRSDIAKLTERGMGVAVGTALLIAGSVIAAIAVIGLFVAIGVVITSAIKHYAEVKMYERDIDATISTGTATGMVASRARKADPIIGSLSEFFGVFNWKAIGAVAAVGVLGLTGYVLLRRYVLPPARAYGNPPARHALVDFGGTKKPKQIRKIPKVKGPFPAHLLSD